MKKKDPTSHRIIEKRRRDRMNNCLADLSKLIPVHYMKKARGRVEKTEIIEMAIKHLKDLMSQENSSGGGGGGGGCISLCITCGSKVSNSPNDESGGSSSNLSGSYCSTGSKTSHSSTTAWYKKAWLDRSFSRSPHR